MNALEWFKNHLLSNRKHLIKVNGVKSNVRDVVCGAPQGSILGPLLFILYIDDLIEYVMGSKINLYADNIAHYYSCNTIEELMLTLSIEMSMVDEWLRANKLTLNIPKQSSLFLVHKQI